MVVLLIPRSATHRWLCALLAALMVVCPVATTFARSPRADVADSQLEYVVPNATAIVVMRPKQVFAAEVMRMMPLEVIQAAGMKELGIDPLELEQLVVSVAPPLQGPPAYAAHGTFSKSYGLKEGPLTEHTAPTELQGRKYLKSQHPLLPSFLAVDSRSLLVAPEPALTQLVANATRDNRLAHQAGAAAAADDDLYALIELEALQPIIGMALSQVPPDFPEEAKALLDIPRLLKSVMLTVNVSNSSVSELVVSANSEADARQVETILEEMKGVALSAMIAETAQDTQIQEMLASADPVQQAMGRYTQRLQGEMQRSMREFKLAREGGKFNLVRIDPAEGGQHRLTSIAIIGVLVALLLPAVQAAREAARRNAAMNNMKMIMLALHNHHSVKRAFPANANYSEDGQPLLSWRVHILPYLEQQALYEQFHLDEPWDSDHNRALIPKMPIIYSDPSSPLDVAEGRTHFLGVKGEGMLFDGSDQSRTIDQIRDGTAKTIAILQVNDDRASIWTMPDDWQLDQNAPTEDLGGLHPGIFLAGFCDGSVRVVNMDIDASALKGSLTISGGEVIDVNSY